ncbi:MAG TPA: hypothetical protein PKD55_07310 [Bellilinea sp.]|nr:hypothetical protein [Bellilinea sp.]
MKTLTSILILGFLLTGCTALTPQPAETDFTLRVTRTFWSGWTPNSVSEPVTMTFPITVGETYELEPKDNSFALAFKVLSATKDSVTVEFSSPLAVQGETGVNLNDRKTKFTFNLDELTKLDTPTLDAGVSYEFLLTKTEQ